MKNKFNNSRNIFLGVITLFFALVTPTIKSQTVTFEKNISVPSGDSKGDAIIDVVYANNKIFAYTAAGILVYNESNGSFLTHIPFGNISNYSTEVFGKFMPQLYDKRLWNDDVNMMTVKTDGADTNVYAVTPSLNIVRISTNTLTIEKIITPPGQYINDFKPLHNVNIIKYDNFHHRLYWLIKGRNTNKCCTGNFHYNNRYFVIYNININNGDTINSIYSDYLSGETNYYDANISDVEFNYNGDVVNDTTYFYLTKLNKIDIWYIAPENTAVGVVDSILVDTSIYSNIGYYKFGKMLYVKENNIHKIIALPYRYPSASLAQGKTPKIYVIDGEHNSNAGSITYQTLNSPSKQILDAVFLTGSESMIVSYAPDTSELMQTGLSDVAVFNFDALTNTFSTSANKIINTNKSESFSEYDINASFKLLTIDQNNILISKKDEIIKFTYNQSDGSYPNSSVFSGYENNFFMRGAKGISKSYIVNLFGNGLVSFNNSSPNTSTYIKNSFPFYNLVSDAGTDKIYCYGTTEAQKMGLYVYDKTDETVVNLNIDKAVGGCIYNPFTRQFLVSENADFGANSAVIKVFNADDNTLDNTIMLAYGASKWQYPKEMYISSSGKLYVAANMKYDDTTTSPVVIIYNAKTYSFIKADTISIDTPNDTVTWYSMHFCYAKDIDNVYATLMAQENTFQPYNTMYNSMFDFDTTNNENKGKLVNLDSLTTVQINFPGKVICPSSMALTDNSQFKDKMFIISKTLKVYDYNDLLLPSVTSQKLNDIVYDPYNDKMYGFEDAVNDDTTCKMDRKVIIYEIYYDNKTLVFNEIGSYHGQASSLFFNPYNGLLYLHTKFDNNKLGAQPSLLMEYDPNAQGNDRLKGYIELNNGAYPQNRSYYPDLDNNPDYHYYNYNLTTPYIDPYQNKIYLPNGAHSNVSVVSFTPDEQLTLNPVGNTNESFTWVSFPRLANNNATQVNDVLGGDNIVPSSYPYNYTDSSYLRSLPLGATESKYNYYTGMVWPDSGQDLQYIKSTLGYKLSLQYNANPNQQIKRYLHGNVLSPSASINKLYADKENWIGYWLYQEQDIFEALGATADELNLIKHQDWTCVKTYDHFGPGGSSTIEPFWQCDNNNTTIKYGDMVVLKGDNEIFNFQWNTFGNPPPLEEDLSPDYYTYEEKEDYKPVSIELDSGDHPQEIGAFVADSCIGATALSSDDTMTVIRAYVENNNDTITFQKYYGNKSTNKHIVDNYYVYNRHLRNWYKGVVVNRKSEDRFFVSFKQKKTVSPVNNDNDFTLKVYPNPAQNRLTVEYTTSIDANTILEVFDVTGKKVVNLQNRLTAGMHQNVINTQHFKNGIYLLRVSTGNQSAVKRFVVNK